MDQQSIPIVELTEQDIPGAALKEPFNSHNVWPCIVALVSWDQGAIIVEKEIVAKYYCSVV